MTKDEHHLFRILLVDDEAADAEILLRSLEQEFAADESRNVAFTVVARAEGALKAIEQEEIHLILADVRMPGMGGIEFLKRLQAMSLSIPVIVISGLNSIDTAVEAIRHGAFDYIAKPINPQVLTARIHRAMRMSEILHQNWALRRMAISPEGFETLIGVSPAFQDLLRMVKEVAPVRSTVLIVGETGTGKELLARAIHNLSPDHDRPYQVVDCTRFPEGMIESELFGHVKGAFTGAVVDKMGLLELADGGSVFLDEIADLPLALQAKLLRVIEEGEVRPVGGTRSKKIDVRFIAATNQDMGSRVERGEFRKDLFYRLNVVTLRAPPLRDRVEDIPLLARHFLVQFAREFGKAVTDLHPSAVTDLVAYAWPGNIRELRNVIERAVMLCSGDRLTSAALTALLPFTAEGAGAAVGLAGDEYLRLPYSEAKEKALEAFTLCYIKGKLAAHGGNVTRAAQDSGVPRQHFQQIMKRYLKDDA
ncbi:MAG: sigma-54-dependent Fis family transcriptional regulator [Nitrospirae bacterium]|nr:MAG: sigma-54-dependent Fis family transcriptional regulator [Nitrospirota bacterium]